MIFLLFAAQLPAVPPALPTTTPAPAVAWTCDLDGRSAGKGRISGSFTGFNASPEHPISAPRVEMTLAEDQSGRLTGKFDSVGVFRGDYWTHVWAEKKMSEIDWSFSDLSGPGSIKIFDVGDHGEPVNIETGRCAVKTSTAERG